MMKTPLIVTMAFVGVAYLTQACLPQTTVSIVLEPVPLELLVNYHPSYSEERPFPNSNFNEWSIEEAEHNVTTPVQAVDWLDEVFQYIDGAPETTLEKAVKLGVIDCGGEAYAQARLLLEDGFDPYILLLGNNNHTYTGLIYKDPDTGLWGSSSTREWANKKPVYETVDALANNMQPKETTFEKWGVVKIPEYILYLTESKDLKFEITYAMMPYEVNNQVHLVMEVLE